MSVGHNTNIIAQMHVFVNIERVLKSWSSQTNRWLPELLGESDAGGQCEVSHCEHPLSLSLCGPLKH